MMALFGSKDKKEEQQQSKLSRGSSFSRHFERLRLDRLRDTLPTYLKKRNFDLLELHNSEGSPWRVECDVENETEDGKVAGNKISITSQPRSLTGGDTASDTVEKEILSTTKSKSTPVIEEASSPVIPGSQLSEPSHGSSGFKVGSPEDVHTDYVNFEIASDSANFSKIEMDDRSQTRVSGILRTLSGRHSKYVMEKFSPKPKVSRRGSYAFIFPGETPTDQTNELTVVEEEKLEDDDWISNKYQPPTKILFSEQKLEHYWIQLGQVGVGFINPGRSFTCYINAPLQCLIHTPVLTNYLLKSNHKSNCSVCLSGRFCMYSALLQQIEAVATNKSAVTPREILDNRLTISPTFTHGEQHDAQEFLSCMIDKMQEVSLDEYQNSSLDESSKYTTVVNQIFGGFTRSRIQCGSCKKKSDRYEFCTHISLDINGHQNLKHCLEAYVEKEVLSEVNGNAYSCVRCMRLVTATKSVSIYKAPNVLILQLNRFDWTGNKVNHPVDFPLNLDLTEYMSGGKGESSVRYSLTSYIRHHGKTSELGHYLAYVKARNRKWYKFSDWKIEQMREPDLPRGGAYVLFYCRSNLAVEDDDEWGGFSISSHPDIPFTCGNAQSST